MILYIYDPIYTNDIYIMIKMIYRTICIIILEG